MKTCLSLRQLKLMVIGHLAVIMMLGSLLGCRSVSAQDANSWRALISPDNSLSFMMLKGNTRVFTTGMIGWGPSWGWVGISSNVKATGDDLTVTTPFTINKAAGSVITVKQHVFKTPEDAISFTYDLSADKDVALTELVVTVNFDQQFQDGDVVFKHPDGTEGKVPLSLSGPGAQPVTKELVFRSKTIGDFTATLDPPIPITWHGGMRIMLADTLFKAGTTTETITFKLTGPATLLAKQSDIDNLVRLVPGPDWFPVTATNDVGPSVIGIENWIEKPACKHGVVKIVGDHFEFADGTPMKFWGVNLAYGLSAPAKTDGEYNAARFAKFGVTGIRMHKFTGPGWEGIGDDKDTTKMTPAGLDRLDYFCSELTKNGVYYGWSHTYGFKVRASQKDRLLNYDELVKLDSNGNTYGIINCAPDIQDLMLEMLVNLLKHKNTYTGKTYAEDPALSYIEIQNEDDIFFYTTDGVLNKCPTYKKALMARFAKWLENKYGSQDKLKAAWGGALKADETIAAGNIGIQGNPWYMSDNFLPGQQGGNRQRLLDNAAFFFEEQNNFYNKFVKAIRDTGYKGSLVGSPWQAPSGIPHYYNLKSDYQVGYIDRHDYFGGGLNETMLKSPGSGDFSSGLNQQVIDRPFGVSEWIHVYPSLYSAEGPAIFAVYGFGLQGWDASYEFQSGIIPKGFNDAVGNLPWGVWNDDVPTQIGQFPALSRMIVRGDLKEGDIIGIRNVSNNNLATGKFDFSDKIVQVGDVKTFDGSIPREALAAGRLVVKFTEKDEASVFPDMKKYVTDKVVTSNTGQLKWDYSDKGFFTVNSPGTKAVVGFAEGKDQVLGNVQITSQCPYASIFLTSLEKTADLSKTKSALLIAVARNSNTGFKVLSIDNRIIDNGHGPILMEPVRAAIKIAGRKIAAVNILNHDGKRTGKTLDATNGAFSIDSSLEKTFYYEVIFE